VTNLWPTAGINSNGTSPARSITRDVFETKRAYWASWSTRTVRLWGTTWFVQTAKTATGESRGLVIRARPRAEHRGTIDATRTRRDVWPKRIGSCGRQAQKRHPAPMGSAVSVRWRRGRWLRASGPRVQWRLGAEHDRGAAVPWRQRGSTLALAGNAVGSESAAKRFTWGDGRRQRARRRGGGAVCTYSGGTSTAERQHPRRRRGAGAGRHDDGWRRWVWRAAGGLRRVSRTPRSSNVTTDRDKTTEVCDRVRVVWCRERGDTEGLMLGQAG